MGVADTPVTDDPVAAGRAAYERHDWSEAFDRLSEADRAGALAAADLERLAEVAFFVANADLETEFRERAVKAYEGEGDRVRAGFLAVQLGRQYGYTGKGALAGIWIRRAERILEGEGETYAHGYLALSRSEAAFAMGDLDGALAHAEEGIAISGRAPDPDLRAEALTNLGTLKIAYGDTPDGMALMEEASTSAVNGELTPFTTGLTTCRMIGACRDLTDYGRASEWIEATERYCENQSVTGFPGICRVHRAEVAVVGGAWDRAERELERATVELEAYRATPPQADGFYAMGDIRRLRGDFAGAEAALREAHARGRSPQPALALIRLAEGKVKAASTAIAGAVADADADRWTRARLLPAQVEIAIAAGDVALARSAADALAGIVALYPSPALDASRRVALGRVLIAEGSAPAAIGELRAALRDWRAVGSPYEIARTRVILAQALRAVGDEEDAELETQAAHEEFDRLGARVDLEALDAEVRDRAARRQDAAVVRMTFLFTDIVGSTALAEALGDAAWERLLGWHDEMLREAVARHHGEIVKTTGDGIFAAFGSARDAVAAAVAIQRALRDQRDASGFALSVRIGMHTTDAHQRDDDYSGRGVHVAARVAALAGGAEVLVTSDTLDEADETRLVGESRTVTLKGVAGEVRIATVDWG